MTTYLIQITEVLAAKGIHKTVNTVNPGKTLP